MPQHTLNIDDSDLDKVVYRKTPINNTSDLQPDLDELLEIFNNNHKDIFNYITNKSVTIIMDDNTELSLHQCHKHRYDGEVFAFIKITNEAMTASGNEILVSMADKTRYTKFNHVDDYAQWKKTASHTNTDTDIIWTTSDEEVTLCWAEDPASFSPQLCKTSVN